MHLFWDSPDPRQGPESPFPGVSGSKNPNFPSFWKREFSVKKSPFFYKGTHRKWGVLDRKLPFPAFVRARGNGGFLDPETLGIRAPVWGRGDPNTCSCTACAKIRAKISSAFPVFAPILVSYFCLFSSNWASLSVKRGIMRFPLACQRSRILALKHTNFCTPKVAVLHSVKQIFALENTENACALQTTENRTPKRCFGTRGLVGEPKFTCTWPEK